MPSLPWALAFASLNVGLIFAAPIEEAAADISFQYPYGDTLSSNQSLLAGQGMISADGRHSVALQEDGNLVEYWTDPSNPDTSIATFATQADGITIDRATLQSNGNLVLYEDEDQPRRASST